MKVLPDDAKEFLANVGLDVCTERGIEPYHIPTSPSLPGEDCHLLHPLPLVVELMVIASLIQCLHIGVCMLCPHRHTQTICACSSVQREGAHFSHEWQIFF